MEEATPPKTPRLDAPEVDSRKVVIGPKTPTQYQPGNFTIESNSPLSFHCEQKIIMYGVSFPSIAACFLWLSMKYLRSSATSPEDHDRQTGWVLASVTTFDFFARCATVFRLNPEAMVSRLGPVAARVINFCRVQYDDFEVAYIEITVQAPERILHLGRNNVLDNTPTNAGLDLVGMAYLAQIRDMNYADNTVLDCIPGLRGNHLVMIDGQGRDILGKPGHATDVSFALGLLADHTTNPSLSAASLLQDNPRLQEYVSMNFFVSTDQVNQSLRSTQFGFRRLLEVATSTNARVITVLGPPPVVTKSGNRHAAKQVGDAIREVCQSFDSRVHYKDFQPYITRKDSSRYGALLENVQQLDLVYRYA